MAKDNLKTNVVLDYEDRMKLDRAISEIEDICPSDSNIFFVLDKEGNSLTGKFRVRSLSLKIDIANKAFDIDNLLDILNTECREKIVEWRKVRDLVS